MGAEASRAEIENAWKREIRNAHPDGDGERADDDRAAAVNHARDVLRAAASVSTEVALREVGGELAQLRSDEEHRHTTERVLKRIVTHHVGQLAYRRRRRVQTAIVSAGIAALLGLLAALGNIPDSYAGIRVTLGVLAVGGAVAAGVAGLMAWAAASAERLLEVEIEETGEVLSDRGDFSATLNEIEAPDFFDRSDLEAMVGRWEQEPSPVGLLAGNRGQRPLSQTAARIGRVDFVRLFLAKGLELALLEEAVDDNSGQRIYGYRRC